MSYDLYFSWKPENCFSIEEFRAYFTGNPFFHLNEKEAVYDNPFTGVSFLFSYGGADDQSQVSFNMNYFRPHVFGLEAEPQVARFVRHLGPSVEDPQLNGMGSGPYSGEAFLKGWNTGNRFTYDMVVEKQLTDIGWSLSGQIIEQTWRWNFGIQALRQEPSNTIYPPEIWYLHIDGEVRTAYTWSGWPAFLPHVDFILMKKERPIRWYSKLFSKPRPLELLFLDYRDVIARIDGYEARDINGVTCYVPSAHATSERLVRWARSVPVNTPVWKRIHPDSVRNAELLQREPPPQTGVSH
jgi:hypothetical protein